MTTVQNSYTDIDELVSQLKSITDELTALHGNLYWLAMQAQDRSEKQSVAAELGVEHLSALKGAVDNMRLMLWNYMETASHVDQHNVQEGLETQRVQRVAQFLQLLRDRLGHSPDQQPVSFIERISAAMKERLGSKVA